MSQRRVVIVAVLTALVAANVAVARLSAAALSGDGHNVWAQGELTIGDEPVAASLFDVDRMLPGRPEVRCLPLRYEGTQAAAELRFYATNVRGPLAHYLDVVIDTGPACDGFTREALVYSGTLAGMPHAWDDAARTPPVAPGQRRAWRFSVTLRRDEAAQGLEATAGFLWEARTPGSSGRAPGQSRPEEDPRGTAVTERSRSRKLAVRLH